MDDFFENAPCGFLSMDRAGCIVRTNATLENWTGYTREELSGKRFYDLLTVGTRLLFETSFAPALSLQGSVNEISLDLKTARGEVLAVSGSLNLSQDEDVGARLTRIVLFQATGRRRYERQLVEASEKSRASDANAQSLLKNERETAELREQFIAVLGHDLRNPLASITGGLRLIQKDIPADRRKLILEMLQGSVERMSDLIDNVLDFARGRLGAGIPLELRENVDLKPVIEQVVAELRIGAQDRLIKSEFDLREPVRCDPSRIGQLVSNLLGNALTHGAPNQPIIVRADGDVAALTIWVSNGGAPIPQKQVEQLFQPFFRGDARTSQQGLGLGLYIASEIAKAHGGTLTVASSAEETRFTFRMPIGAR